MLVWAIPTCDYLPRASLVKDYIFWTLKMHGYKDIGKYVTEMMKHLKQVRKKKKDMN